jgi:hypothetical protein
MDVGPPSHNAQNCIRARPSFSAVWTGSRIIGVILQVSQCRSVSVQPFSIYSPSYSGENRDQYIIQSMEDMAHDS